MTTLLLARHGETDWNRAQRFQGHTDIALNAEGHAQAALLGERLRGEPLAAVYASDLARAYDTALPSARHHGLVVQRETALRERGFGLFEGHGYADIERRFPEAFRHWRLRTPDFKVEGGESLREVHDRIAALLERLALRHPQQTILVVTHGGVLDLIYRMAKDLTLEEPRTWATPNAALSRLQHDAPRWRLDYWADESHLITV